MTLDTATRERWRYTKLDALEQINWKCPSVSADDEPALIFADHDDEGPLRVVIVDGQLSDELSQLDRLPQGVALTTEQVALAAPMQMGVKQLSLPSTQTQTELTISVSQGVVVEPLIYVLMLATEHAQHAYLPVKFAIRLERDARAKLQFETVSYKNTSSFHHLQTDIELAQSAQLEHYLLQKESSDAFWWQQKSVTQHARSEYRGFDVLAGSALARLDIDHDFVGEHARGQHLGFYHSTDAQQHHVYLDVKHKQPHCHSEQHFKGIVDDRAHAVFNTKVTVAETAPGSDAHQSNQNLLLSSQAEIDTLPVLEIYNDDVSCSHGATVGNLDANALFYLRTRGISERKARAILTDSFASDVLAKVTDEQVRQGLDAAIEELLHAHDKEAV